MTDNPDRSEVSIKAGETQGGAIEQFSPKVKELMQRGEISLINPGYGPEQNKLSHPIASTYIDLPDGRRGLVVSNGSYPDKKVQIYDMETGQLVGTVNDERFNSATALASDGENIYITDNSSGLIAKFSRDGSRKEWEIKAPLKAEDLSGRTPPGFDITKYRHSRMIASMVVSGDLLYAYNTAAAKIQIFDKNTGEFIKEIGKRKNMPIDLAVTEDLAPDEEVQFNAHTNIAILDDQILTSSRGTNWEGAFEIPNELRIISKEGKLYMSGKISSKVGEINGVAADNTRKEIYVAMNNSVGIWGEKGFIGEITIPGCPGELYGSVFNIQLDEESGDLIVSHGSDGYGTAKDQSNPRYSQIIRLSKTARAELMTESAVRRKKMLEVGKVLEIDQVEHPIVDKEELLTYADENEGVIECKIENPTIEDVFNMSRNPNTGKYRGVAVNVRNIPVELRNILEFVGQLEYVKKYTDEIVFSPILRGKGGYVPNREIVTPTDQSVSGAIINMESVIDQHIRPGKRIMFINIGKEVEGKMQPTHEVEVFDTIVHEAQHRETIEKVAKGEEPVENRENLVKLERPAYEKQLQVLEKLAKVYEQRGLTNDAIYLFLLDRVTKIKSQLDAINLG